MHRPVVRVRSSSARWAALLAVVLCAAALPVAPAAAATNYSVELDGIASYSTISPFVDASTVFSTWKSFAGSDLVPEDLTLDNYPKLGVQAQSESFLRAYPGWREGAPGSRPVVNYTVTWEGGSADEGVKNVTFINRNYSSFTKTIDPNTGRILNTAVLPFQYDSGTGEGSLALRLDNTLPGTAVAVSNLHIIPNVPGIDPGALYRDEFLRKVSPFKVLRMMDWMQTNSGTMSYNPQQNPFNETRPKLTWNDRPKPTLFSRTTNAGVPMEEIVALANTARKDIWVNIPDWASDDYVSGMANLFKLTLDPSVTVYLEYSNELWNATPDADRWKRVLQDARADVRSAANPYGVNDGIDASNDLRYISRMAAKRLDEFAQILRGQIGAARVKPVLAGQTPNFGYLQYGLEYLADKKYAGNVPANATLNDVVNAIAIAPYAGNDLNFEEPHSLVADPNDPEQRPIIWQGVDMNDPAAVAAGLNQIFSHLQAFIGTSLRAGVQKHKQLADKYALGLESYEAGQHLVAYNSKSVIEIEYEKNPDGSYKTDANGYRIPVILRDGNGTPILDGNGNTIYKLFPGNINGDLKQVANRDPRMALIYRQLVDMWNQEGGNNFTQFALVSPYTSYGSWGLLEDLTQTSSVKWDFILNELAGDANLDGQVDFTDFQILEAHFNKGRSIWGEGDFNLDGVVDYSDFVIFRSRFQPTEPAMASAVEQFAALNVPEPGGLAATVVAALALLRRRRRPVRTRRRK